MNKTHLTKWTTKASRLLIAVLLLGLNVGSIPRPTARAATPGLPFTEDFAEDTLRDGSLTNANWSTEEQALVLAWRQAQYGAFGAGLSGSDISANIHDTRSVALGDVDGDGDLDLVTGNWGQANRLYLNNGTASPFNGVSGSNVSADIHDTMSVALGDVDGDGDLDLVAGDSGQANQLYLNNGTASPFTGVSGSDIGTDIHNTTSVALGDVDEDGDLDLVAGNSGHNRLYLNDGTASPFSGVTGSDIGTLWDATSSVALGDVDGDGDLDLVAGNSFGQANRLYLNDGTASPFNGVTGSDIGTDIQHTMSVALGDVDGDGDLDLVIGNSFGPEPDQANRLYLNNGTASPFTGVTGSDIGTDIHDTRSIALGDVDGDGDLDLVAGDSGQANQLYLNNGTASPFTGITGSDISTDTHNTTSVALGDVDGDGDLDLVAGNWGQANRLVLNNSTDSPFAGITGSDVTTDTHDSWSVALGDVDGDGDPDLVAGNFGQANRLVLNDGTAITGSDVTTDTHDTTSVALGDVDGDGDLDLLAGNSGQANRLYLNNGTASPFNGVTGSDVTTDTHDTFSVVLGDVDGDGDLDLLAGNFGRNRLYLNNGTTNPFSGVSGSDVTTDTHSTYSVALGDVDGDGDLDLVTGNNGANRLYLNDGTASPFSGITGSDISTDTHNTTSVALGDVDGDGDLDLVAGNWGQANRLVLNDGTDSPFAGITGSDITTDTHDTGSVALGDVDGDGDLDLLAGNFSNQANRLYLNDGTASPFTGITGSDVSADAYWTMSVALGDVDKDGDLDLVTGNLGANRLYLNDGMASPFTGITGSDVTTDTHDTTSVALGDVDGDGDLDLLAGNSGQANRLVLNDGTASPFNGVTGSDVTTDTHDTFSVVLGDADGDGDLDLLAGNFGRNRLYLNNGTTNPFTGVTGSDVTTDTHDTMSVALGDVDGDGDLDLVTGNIGANRLVLNNGTASPFSGVSGSDVTTDTHDTLSVALGDVDGDGDLDLVAGNWGQANRLYLNDGTTNPFSGVTGSDITTDTHDTGSVALGDVDGDGDLDLLAGNFSNQANRLYLNNGTASPFTGITGSDVSADAYWTMSVALGDVDKDGDLDLVTGNLGANRLYLNDGTASPFSGISGSDVTTDTHGTWSAALGDVDGDGDLDLLAGNFDQANRLYRRELYHTGQGRAASLRVDTETGNIDRVMLIPTTSLPPNTGVTYWLSNNGGTQWFIVEPGAMFVFPTAGTDLRWRAELRSLSPVRTPRIDQITITIPNQPPVADAGIDQSVDTNGLVSLDGNGSSDPDGDLPLSYYWTQTGGPAVALNNPAIAGPAFIAPGDSAVLTFTLAVTDSLGLPDPTPDEVAVIVNNQPPIANAGSDQSVNTGALVTLNGSGSSDPDGDLPLTYYWTQTGGTAVTLSSPTAVTLTFTAPFESTVLTFTLAVTDSLSLASTPDVVVITVEQYHIYLPLVVRQAPSRVQVIAPPSLWCRSCRVSE